ncbi:MAG: hypothetical protein HFF44_05920 [Lawsonibacter sp.]|nr:hypothetical protein [Lawsonibacter sp.]
MKYTIAARKWLDIAVSGIRFAPDREAVREELLQHVEDKTADLMRIFPDMEEREAQERAVAGMGDAWELKSSLAKLHKPWLGWLWTASRVLLWIVLAFALIAALDSGLDSLSYRRQEARRAQEVGRALYEEGAPDWEGERLAVCQVDARAQLGGAELSVIRAARWRERSGDCLYLRLRITWDRPWEVNQLAINYLWAEDDLGNTYELGVARSVRDGWNWCQRDLSLEGVPREAKGLRIHYQFRDDLDLAVDLTREVFP